MPPRPPTRRYLHLVLLTLAALAPAARGQAPADARLLATDDPAYVWIARLQDRGLLPGLTPGALPYTVGEIRTALAAAPARDPVEARWMRLVSGRLGPPVEGYAVQGAIEPGLRATTHRRLDPVRELGDRGRAYPRVTLRTSATAGPWALEVAARVDAWYDLDPDGMDTALRAFARSEQAAVSRSGTLTAWAFGRHSDHWGLPGEPGLVLSDNARSLDGLRFRFGGRRLALRSVVAELDAVTGDGRFTGTAGDDSVASGQERRWLAAHRLDWSPTPRVTLTLFESVLFSDVSAGWSAKWLNPLQPVLLELDNRPKNDENNGMIGLGVHARSASLRVYGQVLVDDFDIMNHDERASVAAHLSMVRARPGSSVDAGLSATAVASRTYNTFQPEGRYLHLGRGLATQFSDYVESTGFLRWYADTVTDGLVVEPYATLLWQGERDLRQPYLAADNDFATVLSGTVERTARIAVRTAWEPSERFRLVIDAGVNHVRNLAHVPSATRTRASATAAIHFRIAGSRPLRLD